MKDVTLYDRVLEVLRGNIRTAPELARELGVSKSEVNSCLYKGKNTDFFSDDSQPPRWNSRAVSVGSEVRSISLLRRELRGSVIIDFPGGDWELEIQMTEMSRNDPIAAVERMGKRKRLVVVSDNVVSAREQSFQEQTPGLPDAAITTAAAILAWEIYLEGQREDFDFPRAVDDILLSISAASKPL